MINKESIYIYKLLYIIKKELSINSLYKLGLTYSQVANLLIYAIGQKYLEEDEIGKLQISEEGVNHLNWMKKE